MINPHKLGDGAPSYEIYPWVGSQELLGHIDELKTFDYHTLGDFAKKIGIESLYRYTMLYLTRPGLELEILPQWPVISEKDEITLW